MSLQSSKKLVQPAAAAGPQVSWRVPHQAAGLRIDQYLAACAYQGMPACLAGMSRARLQHLIGNGQFRLNSQLVRASMRLRGEEVVCVQAPPPVAMSLTPQAMPLDILLEDEDLIVINKAAGRVVHPGSGTHAPTLVHGLLAHCHDLSGIGGILRPGIVHRLDAGTTGALVVAKHDLAHTHLARQFALRQVTKRYVTLVYGHVVNPSGTSDTLLRRHTVHRQRFCSHPTQGKRAITHFEVIARKHGLSLLHIGLETGRTHQIRVHMAEMGHPIVGDPVYGRQGSRLFTQVARDAPQPFAALCVPFAHQALHAAELAFIHPRLGTEVMIKAPLRAPWAQLAQAMMAPEPSCGEPCALKSSRS